MIGPRHDRDGGSLDRFTVAVLLLMLVLGFVAAVDKALEKLRSEGSVAAPGFMKPEGVVAFHGHSGALFKVTLEKDEEPKSKAQAAPIVSAYCATGCTAPPVVVVAGESLCQRCADAMGAA